MVSPEKVTTLEQSFKHLNTWFQTQRQFEFHMVSSIHMLNPLVNEDAEVLPVTVVRTCSLNVVQGWAAMAIQLKLILGQLAKTHSRVESKVPCERFFLFFQVQHNFGFNSTCAPCWVQGCKLHRAKRNTMAFTAISQTAMKTHRPGPYWSRYSWRSTRSHPDLKRLYKKKLIV